MIRFCTDAFVSVGSAANGAYRVLSELSRRNHHHGGIPACRGASTVQKNLRPLSTNSKSCVTLPLERMNQSTQLRRVAPGFRVYVMPVSLRTHDYHADVVSPAA